MQVQLIHSMTLLSFSLLYATYYKYKNFSVEFMFKFAKLFKSSLIGFNESYYILCLPKHIDERPSHAEENFKTKSDE